MTAINNPSICSTATRDKMCELLKRLTSGEVQRLENIVVKLGSDTVLEKEDGRLLDQLVTLLGDGEPKALLELLSDRGVMKTGDRTDSLEAQERRLANKRTKQLLHLFSVVDQSSPSLSVVLAQRGEYLCNNTLNFSNWP